MYPCFIAVIKYGCEFGCVLIKSRVRQQTYTREVKVTTIFYLINKLSFVSFFVYRKQSRNRFIILVQACCTCS